MTTQQPLYSSVVGADGTATVTLLNRSNQTWTLTQVSARNTNAPLGATCELDYNGGFITAVIPTGDAPGGDPPLTLYPQDNASVVWRNCTPGQLCTVVFFYDDGNR